MRRSKSGRSRRRNPSPSRSRPSRSARRRRGGTRRRAGARGRARTAVRPRAPVGLGRGLEREKADAARLEREREQLELGLERSRVGFGARLRTAFGVGGGADWDEVEETLIAGDVGAALAMDVVERARRRRDVTAEAAVRAELASLLVPRDAAHWEPVPALEGGPAIVLVVGVNGTGKTTTIGKLAARERADGRRVVLAAADTFRAAAIDQLRIWAQRTGLGDRRPCAQRGSRGRRVRRPRRGRRPARGHRHRRHGRPPPHQVEPDGGAGQGPAHHRQAPARRPRRRPSSSSTPRPARTGSRRRRRSTRRSALTGVVLTKLDSTAKGGIVFAIEKELGVPVRFVGVGEKAEDLLPFDPEAFVAALFDWSRSAARQPAPARSIRRSRAHRRRVQRPGAEQRTERGQERGRRAARSASASSPASSVAASWASTIATAHGGVHPPELPVAAPAPGGSRSRSTSNTVTAESPISCCPSRHAIATSGSAGRGERDEQVADGREQHRGDDDVADAEPCRRPRRDERPEERRRTRRAAAITPIDGRVQPQLLERRTGTRSPRRCPTSRRGPSARRRARGGPGRGRRAAGPPRISASTGSRSAARRRRRLRAPDRAQQDGRHDERQRVDEDRDGRGQELDQEAR